MRPQLPYSNLQRGIIPGKINKAVRAHRQYSDLPVELPSLIIVFAVRLKGSKGYKLTPCNQHRL